MRELHEFLNDREIFVLQNHPAMSYKAIGEHFGISPERVRQIKAYAERKIRTEIRREQAAARALEPVTLTVQRREVHLLIRALNALYYPILTRAADQRRKDKEEHPDHQPIEQLLEYFHSVLSETSDIKNGMSEQISTETTVN